MPFVQKTILTAGSRVASSRRMASKCGDMSGSSPQERTTSLTIGAIGAKNAANCSGVMRWAGRPAMASLE